MDKIKWIEENELDYCDRDMLIAWIFWAIGMSMAIPTIGFFLNLW